MTSLQLFDAFLIAMVVVASLRATPAGDGQYASKRWGKTIHYHAGWVIVFAIWTFANLGPRANTHHKWYIEKFGDEYPRDRKRMIPLLA